MSMIKLKLEGNPWKRHYYPKQIINYVRVWDIIYTLQQKRKENKVQAGELYEKYIDVYGKRMTRDICNELFWIGYTKGFCQNGRTYHKENGKPVVNVYYRINNISKYKAYRKLLLSLDSVKEKLENYPVVTDIDKVKKFKPRSRLDDAWERY